MNKWIHHFGEKYGYLFVDPFAYYTDSIGCLIKEYSDGGVHILQNSYFVEHVGCMIRDIDSQTQLSLSLSSHQIMKNQFKQIIGGL